MIRGYLVALALISAAQLSAQSLPSPDALRGEATEKSALLQQYREIMRDPDANVRLAAFTQLAVVDDPVVRQMAYDEAFASTDRHLRSMALRYSFFDRTELTLRFPSSSNVPVTVPFRTKDHTTGDFSYHVDGFRFNGRVQGLTVEMPRRGCALFFQLDDEDKLMGEANCDGTVSPVMIDLRG